MLKQIIRAPIDLDHLLLRFYPSCLLSKWTTKLTALMLHQIHHRILTQRLINGF